MTPWGVANLDPWGLDWKDLCRGPLNITTYKIYKLCASWFQRRRFFLVFPIISLLEFMTPWGVANLDPRGLIARVYVFQKFDFCMEKRLGLNIGQTYEISVVK